MKSNLIIFLVVVLSGCATQQEIKNECQTRVIDHDNRMIMSSLPHSCGAHVAASSSLPDIEIEHIKSSPISYIIVKGVQFRGSGSYAEAAPAR